MVRIEEGLKTLGKSVDRLLDRDAKAALTSDVESAEEIKNASDRLRERKIHIDKEDIYRASIQLLKHSDEPKWEAVAGLLNLRSFVNSTLPEAQQQVIQTIHPEDHGRWFEGSKGKWTIIEGGSFILDAKAPDEVPHLNDGSGNPASIYQYIIFKNCHIAYRGRAISLVNVFFENCTFNITRGVRGEMLARSLLDPSAFTTFKSD